MKKKDKKFNTLAVIGCQWGDEGKGKITDFFSKNYDFVVRWSGGDNAGHSIMIKKNKYKLSIIPSGIFNKKVKNIISNGCVLNLKKLINEIEYLKENNFNYNNLIISDKVHLIFPYHLKLDELQEKNRNKNLFIGTTKKGIGPCYQDKAERIGIRLCDLFILDNFKEKLKINLNIKNLIFSKIYNEKDFLFNVEEIYNEYIFYFEKIKKFIFNTSEIINNAILDNKKILFEGSQGTMLDIDHGTFPFVTSSNITASSIPVGCGISPKYINNIIGVVKSYSTRVGSGPFPTEIFNETSKYIRKIGNEYGTVSGRERRIGWFDSVIVNHSLKINGCTSIAITLLDVLTNIKIIKICIGYYFLGKKINFVPSDINDFNKCEPIFIEMNGWNKDISKIKKYQELPLNAKKYLNKIEKILNLPISIISIGPERNQTILKKESYF